MRQVGRYDNQDSPSFLAQDLHYGLEHGSSIANTNRGSAYVLNNYLITDNRGLKTVTGYNEFCKRYGYYKDDQFKTNRLELVHMISEPKWLSDSILTQSVNNFSGLLWFIAIIKDGNDYVRRLCSVLKDGEFYATHDDISVLPAIDDLEKAKRDYFKTLVLSNKILFYDGLHEPFTFDLEFREFVFWNPLSKPNPPTVTHNMPADTETRRLTYKFRVVAHSTFGKTEGSDTATFKSSVDSVEMTDSQYIEIKRPDMPGATGWDVYMSLSSFGSDDEYKKLNDETLLMSQDTLRFTKDSKTYPLGVEIDNNTTKPLWFKYARVINGRIWACQITNYDGKPYPYRVYWGGVGEDAFTFGVTNGAGYVAIEGGGPNKPLAVLNFRTNGGEAVPNVLTGASNSLGKRFNMEPLEVANSSRDTNAIETFNPVEQNSSYGTFSSGTAITSDTNLYYLSTAGFISTQTSQGTYNLLTNNIISIKIDPLIRNINFDAADTFESVYENTRLFWVTETVDSGRSVLVYDFIRDAFTTITVAADHLFSIPEESLFDMTTVCFLKGGLPYYFVTDEKANHTLENRCLFNYDRISDSRTKRMFGRLMNATVQFEKLDQGTITVDVNGITKDNILTFQENTVTETEVDPSRDSYFLTYNIYVDLYRDNIKSDMVQVGVSSKDVSYIISEYAVSFNPLQTDYAKNRFRRAKGTLIDKTKSILDWLLKDDPNSLDTSTEWDDNAEWDDDKYWIG